MLRSLKRMVCVILLVSWLPLHIDAMGSCWYNPRFWFAKGQSLVAHMVKPVTWLARKPLMFIKGHPKSALTLTVLTAACWYGLEKYKKRCEERREAAELIKGFQYSFESPFNTGNAQDGITFPAIPPIQGAAPAPKDEENIGQGEHAPQAAAKAANLTQNNAVGVPPVAAASPLEEDDEREGEDTGRGEQAPQTAANTEPIVPAAAAGVTEGDIVFAEREQIVEARLKQAAEQIKCIQAMCPEQAVAQDGSVAATIDRALADALSQSERKTHEQQSRVEALLAAARGNLHNDPVACQFNTPQSICSFLGVAYDSQVDMNGVTAAFEDASRRLAGQTRIGTDQNELGKLKTLLDSIKPYIENQESWKSFCVRSTKDMQPDMTVVKVQPTFASLVKQIEDRRHERIMSHFQYS